MEEMTLGAGMCCWSPGSWPPQSSPPWLKIHRIVQSKFTTFTVGHQPNSLPPCYKMEEVMTWCTLSGNHVEERAGNIMIIIVFWWEKLWYLSIMARCPAPIYRERNISFLTKVVNKEIDSLSMTAFLWWEKSDNLHAYSIHFKGFIGINTGLQGLRWSTPKWCRAIQQVRILFIEAVRIWQRNGPLGTVPVSYSTGQDPVLLRWLGSDN